MGFNSAINSLLQTGETKGLVTTSGIDSICTTNGEALSVLGTVVRYGTYAGSGNRGKDILVLAPGGELAQPLGSLVCDAVLLHRPLNEDEATRDLLATQNVARHCLEVLRPISLADGRLQLEPTGEVAIYTRTI